MYALRVDPSGTLALTGGGDDVGRLWEPATGKLRAVLRGHTDTVVSVGFNAGGTLAATASMDATVRVWRVADGSHLHTLEGPGSDLEWVEWHPRGDVVLAGSADCTAWMWAAGAEKAEFMQVFAGHEASVTCGGFTPDG